MDRLREHRLFVVWFIFHSIALILSYSGISGSPNLYRFWPFTYGGNRFNLEHFEYTTGYGIGSKKGTFYLYDWSEFLIYVGGPVLIIFLYKLFRPLNEKEIVDKALDDYTSEEIKKADLVEKNSELFGDVDNTLCKLQKTELLTSAHISSSWIKGIEHLYDGESAIKLCPNGEWHEKFLNVPLLFKDQDDGSKYILIHCNSPEIGKQIIDNIIENNFTSHIEGNENSTNELRRLKDNEEWWYIWQSRKFHIGMLSKYSCIRINFTILEI